MISIIVRTKNEERWIGQCLRRVLNQTIKDIEIILVDSLSTDKTVDRAQQVCDAIKVVEIKHYRPGLALDEGIRVSRGEFLVCLSAHCLPVNGNWLQNLLNNFNDPSVAGVYGRQIPMNFSSPIDKRDLLVTFGLDKRIQQRDTFFHNANSMIRRDVWESHPFDEEVSNIEDRVWAKRLIDVGYKLVYEPEAPVYHSHGIHHNNNKERYSNVVRIMEGLELQPQHELINPLNPVELEIVAIIPVRQHTGASIDYSEFLIVETINAAQKSKYIDRVILSTDSKSIVGKARDWGAEAPFIRPLELSSPEVRADEVLRYSLEQLESKGYFPDLVVPLEITYPFRPDSLLDNLIDQLLGKGLDTVIPGFPEYRPCWFKQEDGFARMDDYSKIRSQRPPFHIGLPSLGCVTYPEFIRRGTRLGKKIGIYEIKDRIATIEIRDREDLNLVKTLQPFLRRWKDLAMKG